MAELYVRLRGSGCKLEWLAPAADGSVETGDGEDEAALARIAAGRRVTVIVPGDDVLLTQARIPGRSERDIAQALPFALEDRLAQPVDDLHFARGPRSAGGEIPVAVVARDLMTRWLARLAEAGIAAQVLTPDTLALPRRDGEWSVLSDDGAAVVRTGEYDGFRVETELAPVVIDSRLQQREQPTALRIHCSSGEAGPAALGEREPLKKLITVEREASGLLGLIARSGSAPAALNLLQGDFAPDGRATRSARRWWPAAAVLTLALAAHIGFSTYEYHDLEQRRAQLLASTTTLFRQAFPKVHRIVNARLQAEQQLAALKGRRGRDNSFLALLLRSGRPLHGNGALSIQGLSYRDGVLEIRLRGREVQGLDRYKQSLVAAGLQADVVSADVGKDGIDGRVAIRREMP